MSKPKEYATFDQFSTVIQLVINLDKVQDKHYEMELLNEWYLLYRGMKYTNILDWIDFHFAEVTKYTHDYYVDPRGIFIATIARYIEGNALSQLLNI